MRVLHLVWGGSHGGTERHVEMLVRASASGPPGFEHHALFLKRGAISEMLAKEGLASVIHASSGRDLGALLACARFVRRYRPDFVHVHTRALGVQIAHLLAAPTAIRLYSEHAPGALTKDWKFRVFYRCYARIFRRIVAIAPVIAETLPGYYRVPSERVVLVHHGARVPVKADGRANDSRCVGFLGRLEPQKRPDVFVDILAVLESRAARFEAAVVGDGSLCDDLRRKVNDLGLSARVQFVGAVDDVTDWFDRFGVFVITSEVEPFGLTALEAMARGVPVVAMPALGGLNDLIAEGGVLLRSRDPIEAADAVEQLFESEVARAAVMRRGTAVALRNGPFEVVNRLEAIYSNLLVQRGRDAQSRGAVTV